MQRRIALGLVYGLLIALAAAPALAGGWAVTTLDPLSAEGVQAGQTYTIGYTIRQHGEMPFSQASPAIRIAQGDQWLEFAGTREGAAGHYVSTVTFPTEGEWRWLVDQRPFGPQELGMLTVRSVPTPPPSEPAPNVAPSPDQATYGIAASLALAGAVLAALSGWRPLVRRVR